MFYYSFLSVVLPCSNSFLRAQATQRPANKIAPLDKLPAEIEKELTILLHEEIEFQMKIEQLKLDLESLKQFSIRQAFNEVDQLDYNFIDEQALRRFLKRLGHQPLKKELIAIMRRFDLDGDAKLSF